MALPTIDEPAMSWLHGLALSIPDTWRDDTVYRFSVPARDAGATMLTGRTRAPVMTQTNVVISRCELSERQRDGPIFLAPGTRAPGGDDTFRVLRTGTTELEGHRAEWQDATFYSSEAKLQLFQRQIAVVVAPQQAVLVALTSNGQHFDEVCVQLGFSRQFVGAASLGAPQK